jgi:transcriptional regulator with XRE-family HTH domain
MDPKTVSRLENCDSLETTQLGTLERIASALGLSPLEFFEELYK